MLTVNKKSGLHARKVRNFALFNFAVPLNDAPIVESVEWENFQQNASSVDLF